MNQLNISVELSDDEPFVVITVSGEGALAWAKNEQSLAGSRWEGLDREDPNFAYLVVTNEKGLKEEVERELASEIEAGTVEIDWSMYSEPEE